MSKIKRFKLALMLAFISTVLISFVNFGTSCESITNKVIRFHIPAASNSDYDQSLKLKVKDEIFLYVTKMLENSKSYKESLDIISNNIENIENKVNLILIEEGAEYKAEAKIKESFFKTRKYEGFTLPAGSYTSLYIKLGSGEGENWWCALYPSLCLNPAFGEKVLTENEQDIIESQSENEISFLIYEWFLSLKIFLGL